MVLSPQKAVSKVYNFNSGLFQSRHAPFIFSLTISLLLFSMPVGAEVSGEVIYEDNSLSEEKALIDEMQADSDGNFYAEYGNSGFVKFNQTGGIKWNYSTDLDERLNGLSLVEDQGFLLAAEGYWDSSDGTEDDLHVINTTNGDQICHLSDLSSGEALYDVTAANGNIFAGFNDGGSVYKISFPPECSVIDQYNHQEDNVFGLTSDNLGSLYSAGRDNQAFKFNATGDVKWTYTDADDWLGDQFLEADPHGDAIFTTEDGVSGSGDNLLHKINENGNNEWKTTSETDDSGESPNSVAPTENKRLFVALGDDVVREWDYDANEKWNYTQHPGQVTSLAWHKESNTLYSAGGKELHKINVEGSQPVIESNSPEDSSESVDIGSDLEVMVGDDEGDDLNVRFYAGEKGQLEFRNEKYVELEDGNDIANATLEDTSFISEPGTEYEWKVNVSDGDPETSNTTGNWNFTTAKNPVIDRSSADPKNGEETVETLLSVNVSNFDEAEVQFYVNGTFEASETLSQNPSTFDVNAALDSNSFYEWYVVAVDENGLITNSSDNGRWRFETGEIENSVKINLKNPVEKASSYNIYRRQGSETDDANFDYGSGDYDYNESEESLPLKDSSDSLGSGNFCYRVTAENPAGESNPSNEACVEVN